MSLFSPLGAPFTRSKTPWLVGVSVGLALVLLGGLWPRPQPNLVLIVVDTLRADAVSFVPGNDKTPHLAALAAEGQRFSRAFSHAPMTLPAHTALFTGRHPSQTGVLNNGMRVPDSLPLLAGRLAEEGYATGAVLSLATLWPEVSDGDLERGFEHYDRGRLDVSPAGSTTPRLLAALDGLGTERPFFLFAHLADPHEPYNADSGPERKARVSVDGRVLCTLSTSPMSYWEFDLELPPGEHEVSFESDDAFVLRRLTATCGGEPFALQWIEGAPLQAGRRATARLGNRSDGGKIVRLRAWINDHPSLQEIRRRYRAEVSRADRAIGLLLEELKHRGLYENTLIVVTSDHGEALGEHDTVGHVVSLFDELLQVPLVMRLPQSRRDSRLSAMSESVVRHVDLVPTILDELNLAGLPNPAGRTLFEAAPRLLFAETHPPEAPRALFCVRDESYKLIFTPLTESFELYALGPDPLELDNVFAHQGHLRKDWQKILRRLAQDSTGPGERAAATQAKLSALGY